MAIREFSVSARRGLVAAAASALPNIVAIAGPNGSGKSALLELLWQQRYQFMEAGTEALYVGPNRTWRAGTLNDIATRSFTMDYGQILSAESLPGFQYAAPGGFNFLSGLSRFGSNADDAQALVKTSIVRIANRAEAFITNEYRRQGGQIAAGSVPDLLEPLRVLVNTLLPHLVLQGVDASDTNNIQVLFVPRDNSRGALPFDIDDLSSGEKAAIALFLPFVERQVRNIMEPGASTSEGVIVPLTVLLDEPEIHLHPLLQINVLDYMRTLAKNRTAQIIFTTHSPTILDALEPGELYLLSPANLCPDNQLSRLSENFEKLEVARSITGATHVLTRGKPIVFIEGEPDLGATASDQRLIRLLADVTEHWAIVPAHGRSQVVRAVTDMRAAHLALPGLPVFGIVDGDQGSATGSDHVVPWPVAMIENLLLDPDAISEVLSAYGPQPRTPGDVDRLLREIALARVESEIRLRIASCMPVETIRPKGVTGSEIRAHASSSASSYLERITSLDLDEIATSSRQQVEALVTDDTYLDRFHGKSILKDLYQQVGASGLGLSWNVFVTEIARHARRSDRVARIMEPTLSRIQLYFPSELTAILESLPTEAAQPALLARCHDERAAWEAGSPRGADREALREVLLQLGRQLRDQGVEQGAHLMLHAVAIGTRT